MNSTIERHLAALEHLTPGQLREKYQEVFGEPTRTGNKQFLVIRIAWRLQSLAEGGLSERARKRAEELANDADLRMTIPRGPKSHAGPTVAVPASRTDPRLPMPGTMLSRTYKGK